MNQLVILIAIGFQIVGNCQSILVNKTQVAFVKNLTADAIIGDALLRKLQLCINWEPPNVQEGQLPQYFDIIIEGLPAGDEYCEKMMKKKTFVGEIHNTTLTSITLPKLTPDERFRIIPECKYNISVVSNPLRDPHYQAPSFLYKVPACLKSNWSEVCSCRNASLLPKPIVKVLEAHESEVNVTWTIPEQTNVKADIIKFRIRIQKEITSSFSRPIYEDEVDKNLSYVLIPLNMTVHNRYRAVVSVVNQSRCEGPTGDAPFNVSVVIEAPRSHESLLLILIPICGVITFCIISYIVCNRCRGRNVCNKPQQANSIYTIRTNHGNNLGGGQRVSFIKGVMNPLYLPVSQYKDEYHATKYQDKYEIDYYTLKIEKQIGGGAFGVVFLATSNYLIRGHSMFAVKQLRPCASNEEQQDFLDEIRMLKKIGRHENIVELIGCCTVQSPLCIVMEYVLHGDLLQYLKQLRTEFEISKTKQPSVRYITLEMPETDQPDDYNYISTSEIESVPLHHQLGRVHLHYTLDTRELEDFGLQIATGMQYLEEKQIVHRDLAARNILIDSNKTLKITDFGMSRLGIYVNTKHNKVPLRWVSIEAYTHRLYSNKSDVWSYGVVLWEISTLGAFPYIDIPDKEIIAFLQSGQRLPKPDNVKEEFYNIMLNCWVEEINERPSFSELVDKLSQVHTKNNVYVNFEMLNKNYVFPPMRIEEKT